jgi:plasmid replication initiation protein
MRHFAMCEKCKELDQSIEHYRRLSQSITDQPTIDRFKEAIGNLFDQKLALHTMPAEPKK